MSTDTYTKAENTKFKENPQHLPHEIERPGSKHLFVSSLTSEVKEGCRYFLYFFYEATKQLENFLLTLFQQGTWNTEYG